MNRKTAGIALTLICVLVFHAAPASAGWIAKLTAQGENLDGVKEAHAFIGISLMARTLEAAPEPPDYSVKMVQFAQGLEDSFSKIIQKEGDTSYYWSLSINPHGNINPPGIRTSTVSWNPIELGSGEFRIYEGTATSDPLLVPDMKSVRSFDVNGGNGAQYFLIEHVPGPRTYNLSGVINILKILTGADSGIVPEDYDSDLKITMRDALFLLQRIAGL